MVVYVPMNGYDAEEDAPILIPPYMDGMTRAPVFQNKKDCIAWIKENSWIPYRLDYEDMVMETELL